MRGETPTVNIVVVDDDEDVCDYLVDVLKAEGYNPIALTDSVAAVDEIRDGNFHIAVIDLMMPKLSGLELLERIRQFDRDIAVIILTGFPTLETASASIAHEVSAYLSKPFSLDEFRTALHRIARRKGLQLRREDELHATIGRSIRDWRRERGLTLKELARRTNLSVSLLSQIERAESSASVSTLYKVANALAIRISDLFGEF